MHLRKVKRQEREARTMFIAAYRFPAELSRRFHAKHPRLAPDKVALVLEGLRQYFLACLRARDHAIAKQCGMPSKAVDDAWHEFIVMTRDYDAFCQGAFGRYLHHTPKEQMPEPTRDAVANTLHQLRGSPAGAGQLAMLGAVPLLFALDRELGITDGYSHDAASLANLEQHRQMLAMRSQVSGADAGGGSSGYGSDSGGGCDGGGGGGCGGGGCGGSS